MPTIFTLRRLAETDLTTIGRLDDFGLGHDIWILEPGSTGEHSRVTAGDYPLELRPAGGKYEQFVHKPKLAPVIGPGLPHLIMHPDRLALIHPGNTYKDTEACALPGLSRVAPDKSATHEWEVGSSQDALVLLYPHIRDAVRNGGAIWHIVDIGG